MVDNIKEDIKYNGRKRAMCFDCYDNKWTFIIGSIHTDYGIKEIWQCRTCKRVVCTNDEEMFSMEII